MSNVNHKSAKQRISDRIKAGKIQRRLQEFTLARPDDENYAKVQMSPHQVTAGFRLLAKVVPDLKQIELTGELTHQVTKIQRRIIDPEPTDS